MDAARADVAGFDSGALRRCERTADCPPGTSCSIFGQCIPSAPADAGVRADASSAPDGGEVSDADAGLDAGQRPDAQAPDAGGLRPGDDHGDSLAEASDLGALGVQSIGRGSRGEIDISGDEDFRLPSRASRHVLHQHAAAQTPSVTSCAATERSSLATTTVVAALTARSSSCLSRVPMGFGSGIGRGTALTPSMSAFPKAPPSRSAATGASKQVKNVTTATSARGMDAARCRRASAEPAMITQHADGATEIGVGERRNGRLEVQGDVDFVVRSDQAVV